jgi:hypothetical protein
VGELNNQLRQKLEEAVSPFIWSPYKVGAAVDAFLDVLANNADQFKPMTFQLCVEDVVRVLRNGGTDG